jgi:hypothetical protein
LRHNNVFQIQDKIDELLEEREKLHGKWQDRRDYLKQLYDQQLFYRDANHLDRLSHSQEVCVALVTNKNISLFFSDIM